MNVHNVPVHDILYMHSANKTIVNKYNVHQCVVILKFSCILYCKYIFKKR